MLFYKLAKQLIENFMKGNETMEYINVRGLDKPVPKLIFGTAWFSLDAEEEIFFDISHINHQSLLF